MFREKHPIPFPDSLGLFCAKTFGWDKQDERDKKCFGMPRGAGVRGWLANRSMFAGWPRKQPLDYGLLCLRVAWPGIRGDGTRTCRADRGLPHLADLENTALFVTHAWPAKRPMLIFCVRK